MSKIGTFFSGVTVSVTNFISDTFQPNRNDKPPANVSAQQLWSGVSANIKGKPPADERQNTLNRQNQVRNSPAHEDLQKDGSFLAVLDFRTEAHGRTVTPELLTELATLHALKKMYPNEPAANLEKIAAKNASRGIQLPAEKGRAGRLMTQADVSNKSLWAIIWTRKGGS